MSDSFSFFVIETNGIFAMETIQLSFCIDIDQN